jgi:hypothetical protein
LSRRLAIFAVENLGFSMVGQVEKGHGWLFPHTMSRPLARQPPQDAAVAGHGKPRLFDGRPSGKRPWMAFSTYS